MGRRKTGFDKYLEKRIKDPTFAKAYAEARAEISFVDQLVRQLDEARVAGEISKAELARRINAKPEIIRRLFTADSPNPTMETFAKVVHALGLEMKLVPARTKEQTKRLSAKIREEELATV